MHRGERCYVVLNLYPYGSGHLMIVPYRHVAAPGDLDADERAEMWELLDQLAGRDSTARSARRATTSASTSARAAGAGIEDHLHLHVVPRWDGDVNFMPVLADVRVMPQHLLETRVRRSSRGVARPSIAAMTLDPSVFKAYDVRGIVPDELDADGAYRIVRAYVDEFEPRTHGDRPRHAADVAGALRGRHPRRARRRLRRRRHRPRRHRDAVLTPSASTATRAA